MKKSTAINIFKGMTITILVLIVGLAVVIGMLERSKADIEEINRHDKLIREQLLQQVHDIDQVYRDFYDQFSVEYVGEFKCTAYCTEKYKHICGTGDGITASGQPVQAGVTVAVGDTDKFPYGTVLYIEGVGIRIVQDTGGGLTDNQIDVAMDTHENALYWTGQGNRKVYVVKAGD